MFLRHVSTVRNLIFITMDDHRISDEKWLCSFNTRVYYIDFVIRFHLLRCSCTLIYLALGCYTRTQNKIPNEENDNCYRLLSSNFIRRSPKPSLNVNVIVVDIIFCKISYFPIRVNTHIRRRHRHQHQRQRQILIKKYFFFSLFASSLEFSDGVAMVTRMHAYTHLLTNKHTPPSFI